MLLVSDVFLVGVKDQNPVSLSFSQLDILSFYIVSTSHFPCVNVINESTFQGIIY